MASKVSNINKNIDRLNKENDSDDYFEEKSYTTHNTYVKDGDNEPIYRSKRYRHRKNKYDSSDDESSDDEPCNRYIPKNFMTPRYIPKNFMTPRYIQQPPFPQPYFPQPPPMFWGYQNDSSSDSSDSDVKPKHHKRHHISKPVIDKSVSCGNIKNIDISKDNDECLNRHTKNKKHLNKKEGKKYFKYPKHHLNKALYYYYNQNPNFNPYLKSCAYKFDKPYYDYYGSYYDPVPSFYYDVCDKLSKKKYKVPTSNNYFSDTNFPEMNWPTTPRYDVHHKQYYPHEYESIPKHEYRDDFGVEGFPSSRAFNKPLVGTSFSNGKNKNLDSEHITYGKRKN